MIVLQAKLPPADPGFHVPLPARTAGPAGPALRGRKTRGLETYLAGEAPADRATRLARDKAEAVARRHPDALVIGSDQVCALGDSVLDKAGSRGGQEAQLSALSGRSADFHTAVCLVSLAGNFLYQHSDLTRCVFRQLTSAAISGYAATRTGARLCRRFQGRGLGDFAPRARRVARSDRARRPAPDRLERGACPVREPVLGPRSS